VIDSDKAILLECFIVHGIRGNYSCNCEDSSPTLSKFNGCAYLIPPDLSYWRQAVMDWAASPNKTDVKSMVVGLMGGFAGPLPAWAAFRLADLSYRATVINGVSVVVNSPVPPHPAHFGPFVDESKPTWSGTVYMKPYCMNCKVDLSSYLDAYYGPTKTLANFCSKCRPEYQRLLTTGRKNGTKRA
jgi:hypothetical protein